VHHFFCWVFVIAIHATHFQDAKTALEINPAEQAVRATALEQVSSHNLSCMHKFKLAVSLSLSRSEIFVLPSPHPPTFYSLSFSRKHTSATLRFSLSFSYFLPLSHALTCGSHVCVPVCVFHNCLSFKVQLKAAATREEYKRKQIAETEALKQSEIGKFLKKRTEDNAEKNEVQKYTQIHIRLQETHA